MPNGFSGVDNDGFEYFMPSFSNPSIGGRSKFSPRDEVLLRLGKSEMGVARSHGTVTRVEQVGDNKISLTFERSDSKVIETVTVCKGKMTEALKNFL